MHTAHRRQGGLQHLSRLHSQSEAADMWPEGTVIGSTWWMSLPRHLQPTIQMYRASTLPEVASVLYGTLKFHGFVAKGQSECYMGTEALMAVPFSQ